MPFDGFVPHWPMLCLLVSLTSLATVTATAAEAARGSSSSTQPPGVATPSGGCLAGGGGYFRARISGALDVDVQWQDPDFTCSGTVRPQSDNQSSGVRMSFKGPQPPGSNQPGSTNSGSNGGRAELVIVLGISQLKEGQSKAHAIPVNVTVIRQGSGEFYGTQGEDKCMLDEIRQIPLEGATTNERSYRVVARGFCTEPARAVRGPGAILISRFDFAGRIDFASEDADAQSENRPSSRPQG